ncbi:MAG: serine hydrolase [Proteobacteria bacterium]|nr:serine hydrolase [Pseudomonadota bacterium]
MTAALVGIVILSVIALYEYTRIATPVGAGYAAKNLCSWVFVSGSDEKKALEDYVWPAVFPLSYFVDLKIDTSNKTVTVSSFLYGDKKAVYRKHLGCTLLNDITENELRAQRFTPIPKVDLSPAVPWPNGSSKIGNQLPEGVDITKINNVIDELMKEPSDGIIRQTNAIVIVYKGQLIAENYGSDYDENTPFIAWSVAKSATATLMGILVKKKKIDIKSPAPIDMWSEPDDPRREITIDQLLRMSSGLEFSEIYGSYSQVSKMLHLNGDMARYACDKPLEGKPDEIWNYSTGTTNILSKIIFDTVGGTLNDYYAFAYKELFRKLGMNSTVFEPDATGCFAGGTYLYLSARDFARLGLLWLEDGIWNSERILPEGWMKYSTTPTPHAPMRQYGAQFWLNLGDPDDLAERKWPRLPKDVFSAVGHHGQYVMMVPSKKLIVVRLGVTFDGTAAGKKLRQDDIQYLVKSIISALPN